MNLLFLLLSASRAAGACEPEVLSPLVAEAKDRVWDAEPAEAIALVRRGEAALSCLEHLATPEDLGALFQAGAAAALKQQDRVLAGQWCADAARLAPGVPFDARLGSDVQSFCKEVGVQQAQATPVRVSTRSAVRLDGWTLERCEERALLPGMHLVQRLDGGGAVVSEWRDLAGLEVEELTPEGPACQDPSPSASPVVPKPRWGLIVGGAALALGGEALLLQAGNLRETEGRFIQENGHGSLTDAEQEELAKLRLRAGLATWGGAMAVGVGAASLVVGAAPDERGINTTVALTGRW